MSASQPPALATWLFERLGSTATREAVAGDLIEQYRQGRSGAWYWRQVLVAILIGTARDCRAHKLLAVRALATAWAVLLFVFVFLGDGPTLGLARALLGWTREVGLGSETWWPFWLSAGFTSYVGFGVSAWAIACLHRRHAGPMLLVYLASVLAVLVASAIFIAWQSPRPVPVPHPLFYIVSVTLPYQWRSGFVLVPFVILLGGLYGTRRPGTRRGKSLV